MRSLPLLSIPLAAAFLLAPTPLPAQAQDAPPVDAATLLKELHRIRDAQTVQSKQLRQAALQQVNAAAASGEKAVAVWEEAVRTVQFQGAPKEGSAFREWKDKEGEALNNPLPRNAARLFFVWLGLTIQRDSGVPAKDLLPQVIAYTRELIADEQAAETLDEAIKHDREAAPGNRRQQGQQRKASDTEIRRMHDQILRRQLSASPVVAALKIADFIDPKDWVKQPGDLDAIYNQIVLPELRAQRDPRVLEYWDLKLKKEADAVTKTKLAFEIEKFNTQRRPALLWSRAEDMLALGQRNRAIGEMFTIIRNHPQNPEVPTWISRLETVLVPPAAPAESSAAGTPALPGSAQNGLPVVK